MGPSAVRQCNRTRSAILVFAFAAVFCLARLLWTQKDDAEQLDTRDTQSAVLLTPERLGKIVEFQVFEMDFDPRESCVPYRIPGEIKPSLKLCIYSDKVDPGISKVVRTTQAWEPNLVTMIMDVLKKTSDKTSGDPHERVSLVDIGCNIGTFTVVAAALGYDVLAVDAMKQSLQLLDGSLRMNNVTSRVTLIHNAVSDKYEKVMVQYCGGCGPASSKISAFRNENGPRTTEAWAIRMDDLIAHVRTHRVLVKIDIEAAEGRALRGAERFFDHFHVIGVLMEWEHVKRNTTDRQFIIDFMSRRGFQAFPSPSDATVLSPADSLSWPSNMYWKPQK